MNRIFVIALVAILSFSLPEVMAAEISPSNNSEILLRKKDKKKTVKVVYTTKMHCHSCEAKIKENISFVRGIKDLDIYLKTQTVEIVYDPAKTSETKIEEAFKKLGYPVKKIAPAKK